MNDNIYQIIGTLKVVPVISIDKVDSALPLADALIAGGLPIAEITFRTDVAADVILEITKKRPEVTIGAGTILTIEQLKKAVDCGAKFGVAPGFNPKIVEEALKHNFPFSPGVMTPSDIEGALSMGIKVLKFFPAESAGGIQMLKSLAAPYAHLGVKFIPTGGITTDNIHLYLDILQVLAVGGTWVAKSSDIKEGKWEQIKSNCKWQKR
jgi:2-dehydro-3-deoxyphosphogluconate aldolase / (4S)-4-hydroxy-2-oxoglutarate aldolase